MFLFFCTYFVCPDDQKYFSSGWVRIQIWNLKHLCFMIIFWNLIWSKDCIPRVKYFWCDTPSQVPRHGCQEFCKTWKTPGKKFLIWKTWKTWNFLKSDLEFSQLSTLFNIIIQNMHDRLVFQLFTWLASTSFYMLLLINKYSKVSVCYFQNYLQYVVPGLHYFSWRL